ncbi:hypothetical protein ATCC27039_24170 [Actinomyces naeslundii]|nr:hypothetical protein ATCC27039_24170 [Actinomyces naeslundii]
MQVKISAKNPCPTPDSRWRNRMIASMSASAERANTLIKVITHSPRAITAIAWVILTLHKRKLVKNLGTESAVRLARLVWL